MMHEDHQTKRLFGTDPTMGLFVALYLILLAFFILMNAVSEHAASRAMDAMESVNNTFQKANQPTNPKPFDPEGEDVPASDAVLKSVHQAFLSEMNIEGRFSSNGGNVFEVEFPADYLFEPGSMRIRDDMSPFLDQLIKVVQQAPRSHKQQMAIMFGSGTGAVAREMTRSQEIATRRAGAVARYLQQQGIPDGIFTTGFVAVPEGKILAAFYSAPQPVAGVRR
ncbi:OmpA family protein [Kordiimonas pumila]|uniref:OmpA family protein n=1 Tax=Kordiimonas pumila TaxID=2161677 RepID=A0ABV7D2V6_9PROT|nr:OmpA family protein [Kordiimonas pumila]